MENESLWSTIPRRPRSPLGLQLPTQPQPSGQDDELLKDRSAELERRLDESKNEILAKLEMLQRTMHQRTREVEHLPENESHANIQFQVGCCCKKKKKNPIVSNHDNTYGFAVYGVSPIRGPLIYAVARDHECNIKAEGYHQSTHCTGTWHRIIMALCNRGVSNRWNGIWNGR